MMVYVICVENENGKRVCLRNTSYKKFENACAACDELNAQNQDCRAYAMKVMRRPSRVPQILG